MSVDFSSLLRKPSGQASKPMALPPGDYQGIIKSIEYGDANKNKTPYVRIQLGLIQWPDAVPEEARGQDVNGVFTPLDLSKRQMRRDFYLTEEAMHRLDTLLRSCGIGGVGERTYEEVIPELVGQQVLVEVQQQLNQNTNEVYAQVGKVAGPHSVA